MTRTTKTVLSVVGIVLLTIIAFQLVGWIAAALWGFLFKVALPLAVVGVIGLLVYSAITKKPLGGGKRRYLP